MMAHVDTSIHTPAVDPAVGALALQLVQLSCAAEVAGAYLPVGRVSWDQLAELADMLEDITPEVRELVERMVANGSTTPIGATDKK